MTNGTDGIDQLEAEHSDSVTRNVLRRELRAAEDLTAVETSNYRTDDASLAEVIEMMAAASVFNYGITVRNFMVPESAILETEDGGSAYTVQSTSREAYSIAITQTPPAQEDPSSDQLLGSPTVTEARFILMHLIEGPLDQDFNLSPSGVAAFPETYGVLATMTDAGVRHALSQLTSETDPAFQKALAAAENEALGMRRVSAS